MPLHAFHDAALLNELFAEKYRRRPVWFELIEISQIEDLSWKIGERLGMSPSSLNLAKVTSAAWEKMPRLARDHGTFRGWTEPISEAVRRLHVPTEASVYLYRDGTEAALLRMRDVVAFERVLWWEDSWLIDEAGGWMLAGMHNWPVYWLRL